MTDDEDTDVTIGGGSGDDSRVGGKDAERISRAGSTLTVGGSGGGGGATIDSGILVKAGDNNARGDPGGDIDL